MIDQAKLKDDNVFSGNGTATELAAELKPIIARADKMSLAITALFFSAAIVFVVMLSLGFWTLEKAFFYLAFALPVGIVWLCVFLWKLVLDSSRTDYFLLLLTAISRDSRQKVCLKVTLRLRETLQLIKEYTDDTRGGDTFRFSRDPWLEIDGRLSDGTSIHAACTDMVRLRSWRNGSGKPKKKKRRSCQLRIQLDYDPGVYGDASAAAAKIPEPFRLPKGASIKATSFTDKNLSMKAVVVGDVSAANLQRVTEGMLLGGYRILNLARRKSSLAEIA